MGSTFRSDIQHYQRYVNGHLKLHLELSRDAAKGQLAARLSQGSFANLAAQL